MKNKIFGLALMETASFYGGVRHKRYSGQQVEWCLKNKISAPEKSKICILKSAINLLSLRT